MKSCYHHKIYSQSIVIGFVSAFFIFLLPLAIFAQTDPDHWAVKSSKGFTARFCGTASVVNGKIYAIGGASSSGGIKDVQVYDPSNDTWTKLLTTGDFTPRA